MHAVGAGASARYAALFVWINASCAGGGKRELEHVDSRVIAERMTRSI